MRSAYCSKVARSWPRHESGLPVNQAYSTTLAEQTKANCDKWDIA